jgi:L-threonylcarbamoyladenylate synthase
MTLTPRIGIEPQHIAQAVQVLHGGGIVAFPTDTVYGVGAHGLQSSAVERLYLAKQRPRDKAIPLLIAGTGALSQVAVDIPEAAYVLAERFWPGALTLVLRRAARVPDAVTSGGETVAVRAPDHAVTQALIAALGAPLAATSANLSGEPAPDRPDGVLAQLDGRIDLLLDGGICPGGVASTVLDLTVSPSVVLRSGGIPIEELIASRAVRVAGVTEDRGRPR